GKFSQAKKPCTTKGIESVKVRIEWEGIVEMGDQEVLLGWEIMLGRRSCWAGGLVGTR
ncbi:5010_t:CDS:2, partial [Gigaspora rosea]